MSSIGRRGLTKLARLLSRAADPGALANQIQLYTRTYSAIAQLQVTRGNGITAQMTGLNAECLPKGYVVNMAINRNGNTGIRLFPGYCRSDDDEFDIFLDIIRQIDCTVVGANGLDAGALAANTWYAIWAIGDSTHANTPGAGLASTSFTAPVMPAGYDKKRRVGVARTDAAAAFVRFDQRHAGDQAAVFIPAGIRDRRYYLDFNSTLRLSGGTATAFTSVDFSADIPPTARRGLFEVRFSPGTAGALTDELEVRPAGASASSGQAAFRRGTNLSAGIIIGGLELPVSDVQAIEYKVTQGGANQNQASIRCAGYVDEV